MKGQFGFEVAYPDLKDSFKLDIYFGPQASLNPIISAQHGQNWKISVPIRLRIAEFFKTPLTLNPSFIERGLIAN